MWTRDFLNFWGYRSGVIWDIYTAFRRTTFKPLSQKCQVVSVCSQMLKNVIEIRPFYFRKEKENALGTLLRIQRKKSSRVSFFCKIVELWLVDKKYSYAQFCPFSSVQPPLFRWGTRILYEILFHAFTVIAKFDSCCFPIHLL